MRVKVVVWSHDRHVMHSKSQCAYWERVSYEFTGADPENVEPGGANSKNYQTEPGGADLFFGLAYKGEQGGVRRVRPPLNPRLSLCEVAGSKL